MADFWSLDGREIYSYDSLMSDARAAELLPPPSARSERDRFIAAVEHGLADVKAGRVHSHAEVVAEMNERFPAAPAK